MKKEKLLISLVVVLMITLVIGNVYSLATENGAIKITANTNTANETNETANAAISGTVGAAKNTTSNNTVNNTVNNTAKNAVNNSSKFNTVSESSLPKAGADTTVVFLVLGFVVSAVYAYKKVSDYNI